MGTHRLAVVFLAVNLAQIAVLILERRPVFLGEEELQLYRSVFPALRPREFMKLLSIAEWKKARPGDVLLEQAEPVPTLMLLSSGGGTVHLDDRYVARRDIGSVRRRDGVFDRPTCQRPRGRGGANGLPRVARGEAAHAPGRRAGPAHEGARDLGERPGGQAAPRGPRRGAPFKHYDAASQCGGGVRDFAACGSAAAAHRASRTPENCHRASGGKKLRYVGRMWLDGVAHEPPRSTYWLHMNLPLYSPSAPPGGA